jgi:MFS transporter, OPA family, glycerol-3-phosphate transporter
VNSLIGLVLLLVTIGVVVMRLPKVELGHSPAYRRRRILNWVPLGLSYAFLYFGRYNLAGIIDLLDKQKILTKGAFNELDGIGAVVYGVGFLINGPLTDLFGGRVTMIAATAGSALMNLAAASVLMSAQSGSIPADQIVTYLTITNAVNMYFQSFGAVSIVKVNAPWFHVRERGVLGALFGILISLGLYFSYDWSKFLAESVSFASAFYVPAAVLLACCGVAIFLIKDTPSDAGFPDFDTGDASSGQTKKLTFGEVLRKMFSQRVIWVIVGVEFCSGFLRQAVMKQYRPYARAVGESSSFVFENWGLLLCVAGILGGVFAGTISDHLFQSRRGPVAAVLYGGLLVGAAVAVGTLGGPMLGASVIFMSLCVIGVHGMLSGTASMDFGGSKNAGVVTGVIDGFVYLGGAAQAFLFARILPVGDAAKEASAWSSWPMALVPVALVGLALSSTLWNARPQGGTGSGH